MPHDSPPKLRVRRCFLVVLLLLTMAAFWKTALGGPSPEPVPQTADQQAPAAAEQPAGASHEGTEADMLIASLFILVLTGFVGFEVIGGVSPLLHTPLMSATNAISAISVVGALVVAGSATYDNLVSRILGFLAVTAAMINVVGGFMITDRMLRMFKLKEQRS
jgi:H+-translocating NAD(P) transhydrogenase subunit alpha